MTGQNSRRTTRQGVSQWLGHDHRNLSTSIDVSGVVHYRGMTSSTDPSELTDLRKTVETFWATAEARDWLCGAPMHHSVTHLVRSVHCRGR